MPPLRVVALALLAATIISTSITHAFFASFSSRPLLRMSASAGPTSTSTTPSSSIKQPLKYRIADRVVGTLFSIDPIFNVLSKKARESIIVRSDKIGVSWSGMVDQLKERMEDLEGEYEQLNRPSLTIPEYYQKPFHAYKEGNLGWQPAMEFEAATLTVHAPLYTTGPNELEADGDEKLRGNFHARMRDILAEYSFIPKRIVDIGCAAGMSTLRLQATFPEAQVLGVDLSPYMLSVAQYNLKNRPGLAAVKATGLVEYAHAAGEDLGLPDASMDMVSICLVNHELPNDAARRVYREAYRVLRPGGVLSFMDMDPTSPAFQRIVNNPMLFALFKSTEPWLKEYVTLDLPSGLQAAGFSKVDIRQNSPRHRTVVAFK